MIYGLELPAEDYPIGQIAPMGKDGVGLVGRTTQEALESFVSNVIEHEKDEWQREEILRLSRLHP